MREDVHPVTYAIEPLPITTLPVAGTDESFPVSRVYCVGRNYAEHTVEMGGDPDREPPFFFAKPADAVVPNGGTLPFPSATEDLHHEIELVVALGEGGADLFASDALSRVFGYAVGLDMTRRDLQAEAKKAGRPSGDLIMTGTPKGVGPVSRGDRLVGHIDEVGDLEVEYQA
jgi:fumarylpyruvate hydrolase